MAVKRTPLSAPARHGRAVAGRDLTQRGNVDIVKTADIDAEFVRIAAALMVGIDAADPAEIMLRDLGVPLIEAEHLLALHHAQLADRHRGHDRALAATE